MKFFEIQLCFVNDDRKFMRSYQDLVHSINAPTVQKKKNIIKLSQSYGPNSG